MSRRRETRAHESRPERRPARGAAAPLPPVPLAHPAFLLALAVVAAGVLYGITYRLLDTDFWQHLAVGRAILREGRVPVTQVWTWPTFGAPDVTPSWGFRAILAGFWQAGGMVGLFVWRWLATLLALGLAWWTARRMGARGFAPLVVLAWAALPLRLRAQTRPEGLALVLAAAQLLLHETIRRAPAGAPRWRPALFALPAIALVWANVHISWWVGYALQAFYVADALWAARRDRSRARDVAPLAAMLGASVAVSFLNPGGARALGQPFEYWLVWRHELIYRQIGELEPLHWNEHVTDLLPLLLGGWAVLLVVRIFRRGLDVAELLIAALFGAMAFTTQRFLGFFAVAATAFLSRDLGEALAGARPPALRSPWARAGLVAALAVLGSLAEWRNPTYTSGVGVEPQWRPLAACDFIERHGVRGRAFNHYEYGGYLLWRFHPDRGRLPFMDIHQSGTREDRDLYARAMIDPAAWRALEGKYRFDWALLNRYNIGGDLSLDNLDADTAYALVFMDDVAALYVRRSGPLRALADSHAYRALVAGNGATQRLAEAVADSAKRPAFRAELRRIEAESPFHASALSLEANLLFREGRLREARDTLRATLAIDRHFPLGWSRLAEVALALGRPREAAMAAQRGLRGEGPNDRVAAVLARARAAIREREPGSEVPAEPIVPAKLPVGWPRGN